MLDQRQIDLTLERNEEDNEIRAKRPGYVPHVTNRRRGERPSASRAELGSEKFRVLRYGA